MSQVIYPKLMTKAKYWQCVRIDAGGNRRILEIAPAKAFLASAFSEFPYNWSLD
ncbi:MAG: hypothetical protein PUP93_24415 [Rhizonema sp. NSF051]|nr:hypothetical protein [Rhizonema sp. NSF051]